MIYFNFHDAAYSIGGGASHLDQDKSEGKMFS